MYWQTIVVALLANSLASNAQEKGICKEPTVEKRRLADDARYASPFYVIALPRTPKTEQMDNVCYSYFENNDGGFFHVISVTFKNGSNQYHTYTKGDLADRMGLAEGKALTDSQCVYHDYTLTPICNVTVFILYRCFIEGTCSNIDIGRTPGVDVRVVLAASPNVSQQCQQETQASLRDTSALDGGDYILLPQRLKPQCITKYNNSYSIGHDRAAGTKAVTETGVADRFGSGDDSAVVKPAVVQPTRGPWSHQPPASNTYANRLKTGSGYQRNPQIAHTAGQPGYTPAPAWTQNNGMWNPGPALRNGQTAHNGAENHFHIWQSPSTEVPAGKNSANVVYHIHRWENPPPGCCKCT